MASEKRSSSESGKDAKFAPGTETSSIHEGKFHDEAFIEGSEGVTQHDLDTLRHVGDRLPYSAWLVVTVEFAERYVNFRFLFALCGLFVGCRWTYYGTTNIFNNYIRAPLPKFSTTGAVIIDRANGVAGALGKGQQTSFAIRTVRISLIIQFPLWIYGLTICLQFNSFWVYVTPWLGGILADTVWGRYKTIMVFALVCL